MNQHDNKQPKKLNLSRETVRILSNQNVGAARKELTSPICTEYGTRCDL